MGTKKDSKETGKGEVTAKDIKVVIEALNKFLKKKKMTVCVIGKNKATGMKNFEAMIDSLDEAVAEKLPGKVIDFYNDNFGEEEGAGEETEEKPAKKDKKADKKGDKKADKKSDKKDKPKKEKAESNEAMTVRLILDGKTDKEITNTFVAKYKKLGKDKEFAQKRADKYIHQERKKLIAAGKIDAPEVEEKPAKKDKKDKAGKKDDKKSDKKSDKKADKKGKKSDKKGK